MKYVVKSVNARKVAIVSAAYMGVISILFIPIFALSFFASPSKSPFPAWFGFILIFIPIFYALMAFVMTYIGCKVYNFIAKRFVQIEFDLELKEEQV